MTRYLLDANIFIQAKNLHYGFDFCPAFWEWMIDQNGTGKVASIDKVGDELRAGEDDLSDWATRFAHDDTIVTHEVPSESTRKIKIPNACIGLGVACVSPYEMLRRERARFILGGGGARP